MVDANEPRRDTGTGEPFRLALVAAVVLVLPVACLAAEGTATPATAAVAATAAQEQATAVPISAVILSWLVALLLSAFGVVIVYKMYKGAIDLKFLISEENGQASIARFQLLIFTFTIAAGLLILVLKGNTFPQLETEILGLLGISAGSYLGAKITQRITPSPVPASFVGVEEAARTLKDAAARARAAAEGAGLEAATRTELDQAVAGAEAAAHKAADAVKAAREAATAAAPGA